HCATHYDFFLRSSVGTRRLSVGKSDACKLVLPSDWSQCPPFTCRRPELVGVYARTASISRKFAGDFRNAGAASGFCLQRAATLAFFPVPVVERTAAVVSGYLAASAEPSSGQLSPCPSPWFCGGSATRAA